MSLLSDIFTGIATNAIWDVIVRFLAAPLLWALRLVRAGSPWRTAEICLKHRQYARERYYESAFRSGRDVLYVTIMSEATLKAMETLLDTAKKSGTHLRVLTWHHDTPKPVIEAFRCHLGEHPNDPNRTETQVRHATNDWRKIKEQYANVEVREYHSSPTMQGVIVKDRYALVELLPYRLHPFERPALVLRAFRDRKLFDLFTQSFETLIAAPSWIHYRAALPRPILTSFPKRFLVNFIFI